MIGELYAVERDCADADERSRARSALDATPGTFGHGGLTVLELKYERTLGLADSAACAAASSEGWAGGRRL